MRVHWLSLVLLTAVPAMAADHTETITFQYLPVADVESLLLPFERPAGMGGLGNTSLVPDGLTAWTANPATNALTIAGKRESIAQFKQVLRILDVPPRQIRLEVQVLRLKPEALARVEKSLPEAKGAEPVELRSAQLDRKAVREVLDGTAAELATADLPTANQRPYYVRWTEKPGAPTNLFALIPRLNGDGTVTLMLPTEVLRRQDGVALGRNVTAIHRISVGQTVMTLPQTGGPVVLVTYKSLAPVAAGEVRRGAPAPAPAEGAP